jgi:allantoinase
MSYDTLVENGTVVTAADTVEASIAITDGSIAAILDPSVDAEADRVIDASGMHVLPGGVDPHVHMKDPGHENQETFDTGTAAAAAGGVTTVGEHHRTDPMVLSADVLEDKRDYLAPKARIDYGLLCGGHPDNIDQVEGLEEAGTMAYKSFTCDVHGVPALESAPMLELFREIERVGGVSMIHPEDELMVSTNRERLIEEGRTDPSVMQEWRTKEAEGTAVATTLQIAKRTGVSLWFAHLSHPELVDQINHAKAEGVDVYAETCPHYFYLTEDDVEEGAPYVLFTPPTRTAEDRDELWNRLDDGEIDMVNADHAPVTPEEKEENPDDIFETPFGLPGIETVLPMLLNGVNDGKVSLERVAEVFSTNPAKITRIYPKKGAIRVGSDADLAIVDMDHEWTVRNDDVVAKCGWTPFDGMTIRGKPQTTLVRGEPVFEDGEVVGEQGYGEFVPRTR